LRRFRRFRIFGSIPLLGWLFVQLAATGLLGPLPAHAGGPSAHEGPLPFITICTADGIKEIALPGAERESQKPIHSSFGGCEWCRFLDAPVDIAGPAGTTGLVLSYTSERADRSSTFAPTGRNDRDAYRVRAPPA